MGGWLEFSCFASSLSKWEPKVQGDTLTQKNKGQMLEEDTQCCILVSAKAHRHGYSSYIYGQHAHTQMNKQIS